MSQLNREPTGEPEELNSTIEIVNYDPRWPFVFEEEARRLRSALGDRALRIEHVGSTSVPKLSAKPIIDIIVVVDDSADEPAYVPALEGVGYVLCIREPEWYEHRMLKGSGSKINLHCFSRGCPEVERMVLFRDWLRANDDDRLLYEQTKRELAAKTWKHVQNYADAKAEVITQILLRATSTEHGRSY